MKIIYETLRLQICELYQPLDKTDANVLHHQIAGILSPAVVENLPDYFHGINNAAAACDWLDRMLSESRLFLLRYKQSDEVIGFVFIFTGDTEDAHIGYLLSEPNWGKGLASEVLAGLINYAEHNTDWHVLIAGVDKANIASTGLLTKLEFVCQSSDDENTVFYHYQIDRHLSDKQT